MPNRLGFFLTVLLGCGMQLSNGSAICSTNLGNGKGTVTDFCSLSCICEDINAMLVHNCHISNSTNASCSVFAVNDINLHSENHECHAETYSLRILKVTWDYDNTNETTVFNYETPLYIGAHQSVPAWSIAPPEFPTKLQVEVGMQISDYSENFRVLGSIQGLSFVTANNVVWMDQNIVTDLTCTPKQVNNSHWCTTTVTLDKPHNMFSRQLLPPPRWLSYYNVTSSQETDNLLFTLFQGRSTTQKHVLFAHYLNSLNNTETGFLLVLPIRTLGVSLRRVTTYWQAISTPVKMVSDDNITFQFGEHPSCTTVLSRDSLPIGHNEFAIGIDLGAECEPVLEIRITMSTGVATQYSLFQVEGYDVETTMDRTTIQWMMNGIHDIIVDKLMSVQLVVQRVMQDTNVSGSHILVEQVNSDRVLQAQIKSTQLSFGDHRHTRAVMIDTGEPIISTIPTTWVAGNLSRSEIHSNIYQLSDLASVLSRLPPHVVAVELHVTELDTKTGSAKLYDTTYQMQLLATNHTYPNIELHPHVEPHSVTFSSYIPFVAKLYDHSNNQQVYRNAVDGKVSNLVVMIESISATVPPIRSTEICVLYDAQTKNTVCNLATRQLVVVETVALFNISFPHVGRFNVSLCELGPSKTVDGALGNCISSMQLDVPSGCPMGFALPQHGTADSECVAKDATGSNTSVVALWSNQCGDHNTIVQSTTKLHDCPTGGGFGLHIAGEGLHDPDTLQLSTNLYLSSNILTTWCSAIFPINITSTLKSTFGSTAPSSISNNLQVVLCEVPQVFFIQLNNFKGFRNQQHRLIIPELVTFPSLIPTVSFSSPSIVAVRGCNSTHFMMNESSGLESNLHQIVLSAAVYNVTGCTRQGGDVLQVIGKNFGYEGAFVMVSDTSCTETIHDSAHPHNILYCTLPTGSGINFQVSVVAGSQISSKAHGQSFTMSYETCSKGEFMNESLECEKCQPGSYSDSIHATECFQSPPGYHVPRFGAVYPEPCLPGYIAQGAGSVNCTACLPGSYAETTAQTRCDACELGTWTSSYGSSSCKKCGKGTYGVSGSARGNFTKTSARDHCEPCPGGVYGSVEGLETSSCSGLCPPGAYCPPGTHQPEGVLCPAGTFNPLAGAVDVGQCIGCPEGRYRGDKGGTTLLDCFECPTGSKSLIPGAVHIRECLCTESTYRAPLENDDDGSDSESSTKSDPSIVLRDIQLSRECVACPTFPTFSILNRLTTPASQVGRVSTDCKNLYLETEVLFDFPTNGLTSSLSSVQGNSSTVLSGTDLPDFAWSISGDEEVVVNTGFWKPIPSSNAVFQCDLNLPYWVSSEERRWKRYKKVATKSALQYYASYLESYNTSIVANRTVTPSQDRRFLAAVSDTIDYCYESGPNICPRDIVLDPSIPWETCDEAVWSYYEPSESDDHDDEDDAQSWYRERKWPAWESTDADQIDFTPFKTKVVSMKRFHLVNDRFPSPCTRCRGGLGLTILSSDEKAFTSEPQVIFDANQLCGDKYRGGGCVACRPPYFKDKDGGQCSVCPTPLFYWGQTLGVLVLLLLVSAIIAKMQISSSQSILAGVQRQGVVAQIRKYDKELDKLGFGIIDLKGSVFDVMTDSASWPKRVAKKNASDTSKVPDATGILGRSAIFCSTRFGTVLVASQWVIAMVKAVLRPIWSKCINSSSNSKVIARPIAASSSASEYATESFAVTSSDYSTMQRDARLLNSEFADDSSSRMNKLDVAAENPSKTNSLNTTAGYPSKPNSLDTTAGNSNKLDGTFENATMRNQYDNNNSDKRENVMKLSGPGHDSEILGNLPTQIEGNSNHGRKSTSQQNDHDESNQDKAYSPTFNKSRRKSRRQSASEIILGASIRFFQRVQNKENDGGTLVLKDSYRLPKDVTKQSLVLMVKLTLSYLQVLALLLGTKISWADNKVLEFMRDFTELVKASASIDSAFLQCVVMPSPEDDELGYKGYFSLLHIAFILPIVMLSGIGVLNFVGYTIHTLRNQNHAAASSHQGVTFKMKFIISSLVVMFLIYIPVVLIILTIYECDRYRGPRDLETGEQQLLGSYLTAESSIRCYEAEHVAYVKISSVFVGMYGVGFPLAGCLMIFLHREAIYSPSVAPDSPYFDPVKQAEKDRVLATYGFLFRGYKQSGISLFWEVGPKNFEKIMVLVITVTIPRDRPELLLSLVLATVGVYGVTVVLVLPFTSILLFRVEAIAQASLFLTACFMVPLTSKFVPAAWAATCTSVVVVINMIASVFITVVFFYLLLLNSRLIDYKAIKSKMQLFKSLKINSTIRKQTPEVVEFQTSINDVDVGEEDVIHETSSSSEDEEHFFASLQEVKPTLFDVPRELLVVEKEQGEVTKVLLQQDTESSKDETIAHETQTDLIITEQTEPRVSDKNPNTPTVLPTNLLAHQISVQAPHAHHSSENHDNSRSCESNSTTFDVQGKSWEIESYDDQVVKYGNISDAISLEPNNRVRKSTEQFASITDSCSSSVKQHHETSETNLTSAKQQLYCETLETNLTSAKQQLNCETSETNLISAKQQLNCETSETNLTSAKQHLSIRTVEDVCGGFGNSQEYERTGHANDVVHQNDSSILGDKHIVDSKRRASSIKDIVKDVSKRIRSPRGGEGEEITRDDAGQGESRTERSTTMELL